MTRRGKKTGGNCGESGEENGGPCRSRTCDLVIKSHRAEGCKPLENNGLHSEENPVTPQVTPESEKDATADPRQTLLDALRGVDRDTLLAVLADVLAGR